MTYTELKNQKIVDTREKNFSCIFKLGKVQWLSKVVIIRFSHEPNKISLNLAKFIREFSKKSMQQRNFKNNNNLMN